MNATSEGFTVEVTRNEGGARARATRRVSTSFLLALVLAGSAATEPKPAQDDEAAPWAPTPSDVAIQFQVHFPAGTPAHESARLILEATDPDPVDPRWLPRQYGTDFDFQVVDSARVAPLELVELRLPLEAREVRVRLEASYLTPATVHLEGVVPERGPIDVRPALGARVRVAIADLPPDADISDHTYHVAFSDFDLFRDPSGETRTLQFGSDGSGALEGARRGFEVVSHDGAGPVLLMPWERELRDRSGPRFGLRGERFTVSDELEQEWTLTAVPLVRVHGRVVDELGSPVGGAFVRVSAHTTSWTDPLDGTFSMYVDPAAPRKLIVTAPHHVYTEPVAIPSVRDAELDLGDVEIVRRPPIAGRVLGPDGRPLADFRVEISSTYPTLSANGASVPTGADGSFRFDDVNADSPILRGWGRLDAAGAVTSGDASATAYELAPRRVAAGSLDLELAVCAVAPFRARVEFDDGAPVSSIRIAAQKPVLEDVHGIPGAGGQFADSLEVVDGFVTWDRVPRGTWKFFLSTEDSKQTWQTLPVGDGEPPAHFEIPRPHVVAGIVATADGKPVAEATVSVSGARGFSASGRTDNHGCFSIGRLPVGTFTLQARTRSAITGRVVAQAVPTDDVLDFVDLRFPAGPELAVVVVDAASGRPEPQVDVELIGRERLPASSPNAQGVVTFGPLEPGEYRLNVRRYELDEFGMSARSKVVTRRTLVVAEQALEIVVPIE